MTCSRAASWKWSLTRLGSFARLPAAEKRLALRAIALLAATRAALRILPFERAHTLIAGSTRPAEPGARDLPQAVRRAVIRASRSLPGSSCLAQSLVAERLLRKGGHPARLSIGVAKAEGAASARIGLDAHAWVESGGLLVTGDDPQERYQLLATFGSG
jgi:hypothetical protein